MAIQSWAFLVDSVEFTPAVIAGETSLGGSESACLGLARALRRRGHDIHVFTTKLSADAPANDAAGVHWHAMGDFERMNTFIEWDVVCALRTYHELGNFPVQARLRMLWAQDLLIPGASQAHLMSCVHGMDKIAYVSDYHRQQWEELQPELAPLGWVTRNGIDLGQVPKDVVKDPHRVIHISRPERGLGPLLNLWPLLKQRVPDATLHICRYDSMYDAGGWGQICASYDRGVEQVNAAVGGITYLGELNKVQLYRAISEAAVMWYPGIKNFAETNCIAATESNACGTPFVGSLRGALPETARPSFEAGLLIAGDPEQDAAYAEASVSAVADLLEGCRNNGFKYRQLQKLQRQHASGYSYDQLAEEWEATVETWFRERFEGNRLGVLKQLLHEDDHVAAKRLAEDILVRACEDETAPSSRPGNVEARAARDFCDMVIAGKGCSPEAYAEFALKDVQREADTSPRFAAAREQFTGCRRVLDVACGNGSFAIGLAQQYPEIRVVGIDYSEDNIQRAQVAAIAAGVADRVEFHTIAVYDFDVQFLHADWHFFADAQVEPFDGMFVGEFLEHVANHVDVIDGLETVLAEGAVVVYTCPHGACVELAPRGKPHQLTHVHRFHWDDLRTVFGAKQGCRADYLGSGWTQRGNPLGHWLVRYTVAPDRPAAPRNLEARIQRTRPMPRLTVGIIAKDAAFDLGRCLESVWPIADEIVIGDTGSMDDTSRIAAQFGARVLPLDPVPEQPEGFAGARNAVLAAASGDWFLWIDADEQLVGAPNLRKYLQATVWNGLAIHQNHLYLDAPSTHDVPVRLFRRRDDIRFYGCVHEQPQMGDCNGDITPALDALDLQIVHTGYLTEGIRRDKMQQRNRPLVVRDQQVFPERTLGKVILLRETVLRANQIVEETGRVTAEAQEGYAFALKLQRAFFADPAHKHHHLARPWYETALKALGIGWEVELGLAGRKGGLEQRRAKNERVWVADAAELERIIAHRTKQTTEKMQPTVFHTEPFSIAVGDMVMREAVAAGKAEPADHAMPSVSGTVAGQFA